MARAEIRKSRTDGLSVLKGHALMLRPGKETAVHLSVNLVNMRKSIDT